MQIKINGKDRTINGPVTVAEILREMEIDGRVAVEINQEILPRSRFNDQRIDDGDVVEIVQAIGGG